MAGIDYLAETLTLEFKMGLWSDDALRKWLTDEQFHRLKHGLETDTLAAEIRRDDALLWRKLNCYAIAINRTGDHGYFGGGKDGVDAAKEMGRRWNEYLRKLMNCIAAGLGGEDFDVSSTQAGMFTPRMPVAPSLAGDVAPLPQVHVGFTGHRTGGASESAVSQQIQTHIKAQQFAGRDVTFHHGGGRGSDLAAAEGALRAGAKVQTHLAFPFDVQTKGWNATDKARLQSILRASTRVTVDRQSYNVRGYHSRNQRIVDRSTYVIANYDGRSGGGTKNTIALAKRMGKAVFNSATFKELTGKLAAAKIGG